MTWLWANIYSIMFVFCYIFWRKSRRRRGCLAVLFFFLHSCLFFFRNILEQYVFKTTLCIIFPSLSSSYLFSSIIFWRKRSSGCLAGLSIRRRLVYSPPTGLLCCGCLYFALKKGSIATHLECQIFSAYKLMVLIGRYVVVGAHAVRLQ